MKGQGKAVKGQGKAVKGQGKAMERRRKVRGRYVHQPTGSRCWMFMTCMIADSRTTVKGGERR